MKNKPFEVGERVKMWEIWNEKLSRKIFTVCSVLESYPKISQSGWIVDVKDRDGKKIVGYDSDWFVKV